MRLIGKYGYLLETIKLITTDVSKYISRNTLTEATSTTDLPLSSQNSNEATIEIPAFKLHKLDKGPPTKVKISSEDTLKMYEKLTSIRKLETAASNLYKSKKIRGFCHLYSGQEAVAVGIHSVLRKADSVITSYRCHGWTYLMGDGISGVLSELTGKKSGSSRGKGGSMHMYGKNFYGGNGIVGAQCPLGAGLAFANKYREDGGVCFTLYGDGAANQGQLYEAMNMATLLHLPCVFVCENNEYGMGTSKTRSSASTDYYSRGDYVPGIWVDGMDVLATKAASQFAIEYCNAAKGPLVLEMQTYRYTGHSMSDPGTTYRTREEVQQVRKTRDPINLFKELIVNKKLATPEQLKDIDNKVKKQVDEANKLALKDTEASLEELTGDVYVNCLENPVRGSIPNRPLKHISTKNRI